MLKVRAIGERAESARSAAASLECKHAALHTGEARVETILLPDARDVDELRDLCETSLAVINHIIRRWQATGNRMLLVELQVALNEIL